MDLKKLPLLLGLAVVALTLPATVFLATQGPSTIYTQAGKERKAIFYLWPVKSSISQNDKVVINVTLDTQGAESGGGDIVLIYDPEVLELSGNTIESGIIFNTYYNKRMDSRRGVILLSASGVFNGAGTFAKAVFKGLKKGETEVKLVFDPKGVQSCAVWDREGKNEILKGIHNAEIIIN